MFTIASFDAPAVFTTMVPLLQSKLHKYDRKHKSADALPRALGRSRLDAS